MSGTRAQPVNVSCVCNGSVAVHMDSATSRVNLNVSAIRATHSGSTTTTVDVVVAICVCVCVYVFVYCAYICHQNK